MTIKWQKIVLSEKEFKDLAYNTLKAVEADLNKWLKPDVMSGSSGITIGIGFDLMNGSDPERIAVLKAMGFQTDLLEKRAKDPTSLSTSESIEVDYIDQLLQLVKGKDLSKINDKMKERATNQILITAMKAEGKKYELRSSFFFRSEEEVKLVWDNGGFDDYKKIADGYVGSVINQTDYKLSKERVALLVTTWGNKAVAKSAGGSMQPPGNRAEAWFKIRYHWKQGTGADAQYNNGWAKRAYFQSQIFGLYDNPDNVSPDEAKQVYRMFQTDRWLAYQRENKYGVQFDGMDGKRNMVAEGNRDYKDILKSFFPNETDPIDGIIKSLEPAKIVLLDYLRGRSDLPDLLKDKLTANICSTNIYLNPHKTTDPDRSSTLNSFPYQLFYEPNGADDLMIGMGQRDVMMGHKGNDVLIGKGGNDILFGDEGNDVLYAGDGNDYLVGGTENDVIYGGKGNDTLIGGTGNDTLMGGENDDTYIIRAGDGEDTIEDKQGNNKIFFCGEEIKFFYKNGNTYTTFDGALTAFKSAGALVISDTDTPTTVTLNEDFEWGDFGTTLVTLPTNPDIGNTILGDLKPVDFENQRRAA